MFLNSMEDNLAIVGYIDFGNGKLCQMYVDFHFTQAEKEQIEHIKNTEEDSKYEEDDDISYLVDAQVGEKKLWLKNKELWQKIFDTVDTQLTQKIKNHEMANNLPEYIYTRSNWHASESYAVGFILYNYRPEIF